MNYKVRLLLNINSNAIVLDGDYFNDALLGVIERRNQEPIAVYSKKGVIKILMDKGFSEKKAYEFFENTILQASIGSGDPAFISMFDEIVNIEDVEISKEDSPSEKTKKQA